MKACMVAPTKIIAGLGMSLGIDRLEAPGATGTPGSATHYVLARSLAAHAHVQRAVLCDLLHAWTERQSDRPVKTCIQPLQ